MGQTNEQQRHFIEWPIRELQGEVDSIQKCTEKSFAQKTIFIGLAYFSIIQSFLAETLFGCTFY
jgi:hypothetical protein